MRLIKYWLLIIASYLCLQMQAQQEVKFQVDVPLTVVAGSNFKVSYILDGAKGSNFQLDGIFDGVDLHYGPSVSQSSSVSIINNQRTSSFSQSYTYLLGAVKEGVYKIPAGTIEVNGKTYKTKVVNVKVLPASSNQPQGNSPQNVNPQTGVVKSSGGQVDKNDLFVRINFSKQKVYEQEAVVATFRLYSKLDVISLTDATFPEFQGFVAQDFELPSNRQFQLENYNGQNYYAIDIKKTLLFPQQSGKLTIPSGSITLIVSVPSGKYVPDIFGVVELKEKMEKKLNTLPVNIDVTKLPTENKPIGFSNGVGSFEIASNVTKNKVEANSGITFTIDISGVGDLKLLKNPQINFPKELEVFDPKVNNNFTITSNGESGKRSLEYLVIPRYPGKYEIPGVSFSYYDLASSSYKTVKTNSIEIEVDKDPNASTNPTTIESNIKLENDIRPLNTNTPVFKDYYKLDWGNTESIMWYIIPIIILGFSFFIYRKQLKANADIIGSRIRKANKMAVKRLRLANKYLKTNKKDLFYEESLRAMWGYLSDKLVIPVTDLNRDNIESELRFNDVDDDTIKEIIDILDACEFERYAPSTTERSMDNLYKSMLDLIGKLESVLKVKR